MMASGVKIVFKSNALDYAKWYATVPLEVQLEIEDKKMPYLKNATKEEVKRHLVKNKGVEEGIYKRSFTINTFAEHKWQVGFQVFAKKPHYRLTHLLEDGHAIVVFRRGQGRQTKWGNVGMVDLTKVGGSVLHPDGRTNSFPHIAPAQKYAEDKMSELYHDAVTGKLEERMKKLT